MALSSITPQEWKRLEREANKTMKSLCDAGAEFTVDVSYRINLFTGEKQPLTDHPVTYRLTLPESLPEALAPESV